MITRLFFAVGFGLCLVSTLHSHDAITRLVSAVALGAIIVGVTVAKP